MFGWFNEASVWASRVNRASRSGSLAKRSGSTLIATSRLSFVSRARHTSPIPPAPIGATISYGPRRVPAVTVTEYADSTRHSGHALGPDEFGGRCDCTVSASSTEIALPMISLVLAALIFTAHQGSAVRVNLPDEP